MLASGTTRKRGNVSQSVTAIDDKLLSAWQQPINRWMDQPGSIHNDSVATKIGMRGGTIPGTIHLDHFVPIIRETWGMRWYKRGAISMYYTYATTHREDVRAVISQPAGTDNEKVDAFVETPEHRIVAKGSLSIGSPVEMNYVSSLTLDNAGSDQLRILEDLKPGDECPSNDSLIVSDGNGSGDFDGLVVLPSAMYTVLNASFPTHKIKQAVGFFGATEISLVNGPVHIGREYRRTGSVICVGASPKTEFAWVDSQLQDKTSGKTIATMRHLTRWMKASSPLWN